MKPSARILTLLFAALFASPVFSDGIWTTYPSSTTALAYDGEYFWIGQEYKVLKWHKEKGVVAEYTPQVGVSGAKVEKILVAPDKKTIWAVSGTGMARFDGSAWTLYRLISGGVGSVAFSKDGTLWVGKPGAGLYRFKEEKWTLFTKEDGLVSLDITSLAVDNDGVIWICTPSGVCSYDGLHWKTYTAADGLVETGVYHVVIDKNNVKWFGASGGETGGISRFDGVTWTSYTMANGKIEAKGVQEMALSPDNTLWVSMGDVRHYVPPSGGNGRDLYYAYLYEYDGQKYVLHYSGVSDGYESNSFYTGITFDNKGKLYVLSSLKMNGLTIHRKDPVCDNSNTLWFLEGKDDNYCWIVSYDDTQYPYGTRYPSGFGPPPNISAITIGPENEIWIGDPEGGLVEFKNNTWKLRPKEYANGGINCLAAYEPETICFGGSYGGIEKLRWNQWNKYTTYNLKENGSFDSIRSLIYDKNGILWIGCSTPDQGVFSYDGATWSQYTTTDGLIDDRVHAIAVDAVNTKWFGTTSGVSRFDGANWTSFSTVGNGDSIGEVTTLACYGTTLWAGTKSGLVMYDGISWTRFIPKDWVSGKTVLSLAISNKGVVWSGTINGLTRYDGTAWRTFTTADGLPSKRVQALAVDHDNVVWIGTDKGLVSYQEDTGTFVAENAAQPTEFTSVASYPNPFNPSTTIEFTVPSYSKTELTIYSITGQRVRSLVTGRLTPGKHTSLWDGRDDAGETVSSGVYIARLNTGGQVAVHTMTVVK